MKRSEMTSKYNQITADLKKKINKDPIQSVGIGVLAGMLFGLMLGSMFVFVFKVLLIAALALVVFYFISDDDTAVASSETSSDVEETSANPVQGQNGSTSEEKSQTATH